MDISAADAAPRLRDLVRRAQAGEEVVLTEAGGPDVKLVAVEPSEKKRWKDMTPKEREAVLRDIQAEARRTRNSGPDATRASDFLYGWDGLPV